MPICTQCKSEYVEGITECHDCKIPLIDSLEEEKEEFEEQEVIVCETCGGESELDSDFCPYCGIIFKSDIKCEDHTDRESIAACVICQRSLCSECDNVVDEQHKCDLDVNYELIEDWVHIHTTGTEWEAELAKQALISEGIECETFSQTFHAQPVPISTDLSKVRILVTKDDIRSAEQVLVRKGIIEGRISCDNCGAICFAGDQICRNCGERFES